MVLERQLLVCASDFGLCGFWGKTEGSIVVGNRAFASLLQCLRSLLELNSARPVAASCHHHVRGQSNLVRATAFGPIRLDMGCSK